MGGRIEKSARTIATTCTAVALLAVLIGRVRVSSARWKSSLKKFRIDHHGYTTSSSDRSDALFVVCPASGGGKAMRVYNECLEALERRGLMVEVCVTESTEDLINLTIIKDFKHYSKMIAVLGGDSTIYELIQTSMRMTNGQWPYAPILVLPGGSSNVLSSEFHGLKTPISEIVEKARVIRKGSVLKCSSPGATTRYSVHDAFDGCQRIMIEKIEKRRSSIYAAFGKLGFMGILWTSLFSIPFHSREELSPYILSIFNSDHEAEGTDLGFGVNRFDDKMIVIYKRKNDGLVHLVKTFNAEMSGGMGQDYLDGKTFEDMTVKVTNKSFTVEGDGHYHIFSDGTSVMSLEGDKITFEVVTDAIPYYIFDDKDLPAE